MSRKNAASALRRSGIVSVAAWLLSTITAIGIGEVAGPTRSTSRLAPSSLTTKSVVRSPVTGARVFSSKTLTYSTRSLAEACLAVAALTVAPSRRPASVMKTNRTAAPPAAKRIRTCRLIEQICV